MKKLCFFITLLLAAQFASAQGTRPELYGPGANSSKRETDSRPATRQREAFPRLQLSIGPEFSFLPKVINEDANWISDSSGYGMKTNLGFSVRGTYRFSRVIGASLTLGYAGWEFEKSYTREDVKQFSETLQLTRIPVQAGIKINITQNWYIMPEGGVNLLFTSAKASETHPEPVSNSSTAFPVTYGGSLGYEIQKGKLLADFSVRYQILDVKKLDHVNAAGPINEKVNMITLRVGIGLTALNK